MELRNTTVDALARGVGREGAAWLLGGCPTQTGIDESGLPADGGQVGREGPAGPLGPPGPQGESGPAGGGEVTRLSGTLGADRDAGVPFWWRLSN